jgi:hypothetical protein
MTTEVTNQELREMHTAFFAEIETLRELLATAGHVAVTQDSACLESRMRTAVAGILLLQRNIAQLEK